VQALQQQEGDVVAGDVGAAAERTADLDQAGAGGVGQVARLDDRPVEAALLE
jgi:hypothetical protein